MRRALALCLVLGAATACWEFDKKLAERCDAGLDCTGGATDGSVVVPATNGICNQGFCWENPLPHGLDYTAVYAPAQNELWLGTSSELIFHVHDGTFDVYDAGPVNAMWGASGTDVWLVGPHPRPLRWNGTALTRMGAEPTMSPLFSVAGGGTSVWVGGEGKNAVSMSGGAFTQSGGITGENTVSMAVSATGECWAVSALDQNSHVGRCDGTLIYDGGTGDDQVARAVWIAPDGDLYFGGASTELHHRPTAAAPFETVSTLGLNVRAGTFLPGTHDIVAVGNDGQIFSSRGPRLDTLLFPSTNRSFSAVAANAPNDIWAAGQGGALAHWNGEAEVDTQAGVRHGEIYSMTFAASALYAAGGNGVLLRNDAGVWEGVFRDDNANIRPIFGFSDGTVMAAGQNVYLGPVWSTETLAANDVNGLWGTTPNDVWAVGEGASVSHRSGPNTWQPVNTLSMLDPSAQLTKVWGNDAGVWAVGGEDGGEVVLQLFPDAGLGRETLPENTGTLYGVWLPPDSNEVFAVGDGCALWYRSPTGTWSRKMTPAGCGDSLYEVWGFDSNDVWAVGNAGTVIHWGAMRTPKQFNPGVGPLRLEAVRGIANRELFIGGARDLILRKALP